jgi:hypothetical protein
MSKAEQNRLRLACPNEAIVRGLSYRANEAQHILFGLKTIGDVIDPEGKFAAKVKAFLDEANTGITLLTPELGKQRREHVQTERKRDKWASPSCLDGWMCPKSPTGACEYGNGDPDDCDHCGFPEERK